MLTQSCVHAMLLCVKPQEAALAHTQRRAPLLRTPLTHEGKGEEEVEKKKKENSSLCAAKTSSTSQAVLLLSFKRSRKSLQQFSHNCHGALECGGIFIWALQNLRSSYDKGELRSKTQPAACSYVFLLTYFDQKAPP